MKCNEKSGYGCSKELDGECCSSMYCDKQDNSIGYMCLDSYAGRREIRVRVIKETAKRLKVELLEDCMRGKSGDIIYIPKYAFKPASIAQHG